MDEKPHTHVMPWRVRIQHIKEYPARTLRLLGRRPDGIPICRSPFWWRD